VSAIHELKGFQRVHLDPGAVRHVRFELDPRELSQVDAAGMRSVQHGTYGVFVGGRQPRPDEGQAEKFVIQGSASLPR
jgi:beta-glucosidase